ncbi:putative GAF domain containing protein [Lyophyllum shimeji]|uniref:GAF domain containing protein n=1 Tax=Lyophyllum shimeji TaxID=47721 RepID=A0A9P3UJ52_LYOSH|nr:putative GAF domain containing protein [Lyophyllum shimeji]
MRKKLGHSTFPTLYFRDGVLSVPEYTFDKAYPWQDTGGMTMLAEGSSLKDGSNIIAKIAPAQSNGSMCLEREAHILGRMANTADGYSVTLRMLEYLKIPREHGDCVVLILGHPGLNLLGRYLPSPKVNDLLLADVSRVRPSSSHGDVFMMNVEEESRATEAAEATEAFDIMDLASFLEFAIQATRCLENLHKTGIIHREVRANAFHLNAHSGFVRIVHFGNRAISLENFGSPSSLVLRAFGEVEKVKVKEALCYLAPEQTGSIETMTQDHRTDLYSLGILFWTLLVGRGQMPFEGEPLELLHAIVQKRPMPVHEVRRDVPQVLALIIEKLLSKNPDTRYQSAHGLQRDLLECQRRLLATVTSPSEESTELIRLFEIAREDRFMEFTMPMALFGREKELEIIRNVIRNASTSFSRHFATSKGCIAASNTISQGVGPSSTDDLSETLSTGSDSPRNMMTDVGMGSPSHTSSQTPERHTPASPPMTSLSPSLPSTKGLRQMVLRSGTRPPRNQAVMVVGPPGIGKSSVILVNQAKWRSHGLWGQAKFQNADSAPFAALLGCLSSVLRQLMVFHTDLRRFVDALQERLGPQLQNVPLLYEGTPELKDVLALFGITLEEPTEQLSTGQLRVRFQSLVENVFSVIAETRLFALFLDDLHEADASTLDLVSTLLNSRSRMLIFATIRSGQNGVVEKVRSMFTKRSKPTWIFVEPLSYSAVASLVSQTLHQPKEDCVPLSRFIYAASSGNAFSARSILNTLHRQHHITFDWAKNHWKYDIHAIEGSLNSKSIPDPTDISFLISHMRELPEEARKYLLWAAFFGETFKVTEVALMMDWEDSAGSGSEDEREDMWDLHKAVSNLRETNSGTSRASMRGLQFALSEGWLIQRARDMCSFAHDRYRQAVQAEADALPQEMIAKMSLRIILMMLHETPIDVHRIAEHAKHCLPLLHENPKREELLDVLIDAGESAWARGAHELAIRSFISARSLLHGDPWEYKPHRTFGLLSRLAALFSWKGDYATSNGILEECLAHALEPEDKGHILRLRSRNHFLSSNFSGALNDTLLALKVLGVEINPTPTAKEANAMFDLTRNEILAVGFDEILNMPRTTDPRIELAVGLLNDAGLNAYWDPTPSPFGDTIGLTTIQVALRYGMSPGAAVGFFWAVAAAAEQRGLYRFSVDLGKLALRIAEKYGHSGEKCRAQVMYCVMVSGYDSVHIRANIPRLQDAIKHGNGAGDRVFTSYASIHLILNRLFVCDHLSDLVVAAEECFSDVRIWSQDREAAVLAIGVLNCIRALGGNTKAQSVETLFDTDTFKESDFLEGIHARSGNVSLLLGWYNAFKVVSYFCTGYIEEAAQLGYHVFESRHAHPNHRHIRYALFFHSLALVACIRKGKLTASERARHMSQITENQACIRRWHSPSPVNTSTWVALVEAEVASLTGSQDAFRLYDIAVKLAVNNDWVMEEGWALYLQGCHLVRCRIEGLGGELQRRGIVRHSQWGAQGIVNRLTALSGIRSQCPLKRSLFTSDAAVQTEYLAQAVVEESSHLYDSHKMDTHDDQESTLSASDLASILKWSKDISSDINLSSALQRLTEIVTETSGSLNTCVAIAREAGDYTVATSMIPPQLCQVHENPKSIRTIVDPLQKAIIQHALNSKEQVCYEDASLDSRFSSEAGQTVHRSVICLPIFSNRGQTFGAVYVASNHPFSRNTVTILTLLCQQASISISNALLFRSVQAGTRENLKMISAQKEALEAARKSREDALKATKIKSNFLASMSHELRTPFSSFYGLLDLLSGTELNPGQSEIVQTAKQSCELLLKIIDSILDYSKLEASAVKLEPSGFLVENIIADCMELLLPMAAKKLDLSFNIEATVPSWVYADYARIRQVLMNLIGNAVKFTAHGSVRVTCSADSSASAPGEVDLKFEIQDTGIGLAASDVDLLFVPFQQADNSSTRRFGGTGLGLSISRQLVKLMGGAIGVHSELNSGSIFWFTIPVKIHDSEESRKSDLEIQQLKSALMAPHPPRILVCSKSDATLAFLNTMFNGFYVILTSSIQDAKTNVEGHRNKAIPLDFLILDDQTEQHVEDLLRFLHTPDCTALRETKLIHLYTPTTSRTGHAVFGTTTTPGVVKMTKPPRKARVLQTLAGLKELPNTIKQVPSTTISKAMQDVAAAQRTLYGNVLIAEDNPIAQNLLVKQLERFQLNVTATGNGEEAIAEWEAHEPGYFSVALFDHHMPICDGVEAAKRLRHLENKRKCSVLLPIVALSADCQDSTKQLCLSAGMNAFFSKPLKKGELMSLLSMFGQAN